MRKLTVETIVIPVAEGLSLEPSINLEDRITDALEVMLKNDLKRIAVFKEGQAVGMIKLDDVLKNLGLEKGKKKKGRQSLVVHGRKIVVDKTEI